MSERTPGPWVAENQDSAWGCFIAILQAGKPHSDSIAHIVGVGGKITAEMEANAAFIAKACNAHDELVAALKEAQELLAWMAERLDPKFLPFAGKLKSFAIESALAKAEGK